MVTASQLRISSRRPSYRATSADMVAAPADENGSGREGRPVVDPEGHRRAWRRLGDLEIPARQSEQKSPFAVLHSDQGVAPEFGDRRAGVSRRAKIEWHRLRGWNGPNLNSRLGRAAAVEERRECESASKFDPADSCLSH